MRFGRAVGVGVLSLTVAACGSLLPSAKPAANPNWVWHIENRVSQAPAIEIDVMAGDGTGDGGTYFTGLRPCSDAALAFGDQIPAFPSIGRWQTLVLVDPTGEFDRALAEWKGDPHEMPGTFRDLTTVVWSNGEVELASLPRWLTIGADGASVRDAPTPIPSACPSLDDSSQHPTP